CSSDLNNSPRKVSLYGPEGEQRWAYDPSLSETIIARGVAARLIDVDGDGTEEVFITSSLQKYEQVDGEWLVDRNYRRAKLDVLELDGTVLVSQEAERWGAVLHVAPGPEAGAPPTLICSGGSQGLQALVYLPFGGGEDGDEPTMMAHDLPPSGPYFTSRLPGADLDGEGGRDVVRTGHREPALEYVEEGEVYRGDFDIAEHFELQNGRPQMQWRDVTRLRANGRTYWALVIARYRQGPQEHTLFVCDERGKLLWKHTGGVSEDTWRQLSVEAGDLDGDGNDEIILATQAAYWRQQTGGSRLMQAQESYQAYLEILTAEGDLLSRKRIGAEVGWVHLMPADADGVRRILAFREDAARRFEVEVEALESVKEEGDEF
ncbi:MAG: hypothetical protein ACF8NJ_06320, partial [Phycisphaerales bacterium JB038]